MIVNLKPSAIAWRDHFAHCPACRIRIDAVCDTGRALLQAALVEREIGR